jgi:hypothetical protein
VFDIVAIAYDFFFPGVLVSAIDLCHTSDTWLHRENLVIGFSILFDFTRLMWARSDEGHISPEHIPELRELVEWEPFDELTESHLPWIVLDFVEWSISSIVFGFEFFFVDESLIVLLIDAVGIFHWIFPVHISELVEFKYFSIFSYSPIPEDDWPRMIFELDPDGNDEKNRRQEDKTTKRKNDIEGSFWYTFPFTHRYREDLNDRHITHQSISFCELLNSGKEFRIDKSYTIDAREVDNLGDNFSWVLPTNGNDSIDIACSYEIPNRLDILERGIEVFWKDAFVKFYLMFFVIDDEYLIFLEVSFFVESSIDIPL